MNYISDLPRRQKVFIFLTMLIGLFILFAYRFQLVSMQSINLVILFYGFGVPFLILTQNLLVDLNDKRIFKIWTIIGVCFLIAYFLSKNNQDFTIRHSPDNKDRGIGKIIANGSTNALKSLPVFLIFYWIINNILKRKTGNYIINTFKKIEWHDDAQRSIDWYDFYISFILVVAIICAAVLTL
jgi:hypothetical protein